MNLNAYFLWTAGAAALGAFLFWMAGKDLPGKLKRKTLAMAFPMGIIGGRAFYVLARLGFFLEIGGTAWLWPTDWSCWGVDLGFALWGTIFGVTLAGMIAAGQTGLRSRVLDALAVGGSLAIGLYRFGEFLIGEGMGPYVETDALCFFPFAVLNEWEEWVFPVYLWEGAAALIICGILLGGKKKRIPGNTARLGAILFCSSQILLESLRRDSFLRWMFVRVSQVTAALVLAGIMTAAVIRIHQDATLWKGKRRSIAAACTIFLLCTAITVWLEFAMDKSAFLSLELCYLLEGLCCMGLGAATHYVALRVRKV